VNSIVVVIESRASDQIRREIQEKVEIYYAYE